MLPYSQMDISTVCLLFLTVRITFELGIRDRDRGMFSSVSLHFAYSFQKARDEKMSAYSAFYFLFMPSRSPTKLYLIVSHLLCPVILGIMSEDRWEKPAYNKGSYVRRCFKRILHFRQVFCLWLQT